MSIHVRRCLSRSRLVEGLVEDWQIEHDRAMFAQDVEALARECIEAGNLTNHTWAFLLDQLVDGRVLNLDDVGDMMEKAVAKTLSVFEIVRKLIAEAKEKGFTVAGAAEFDAVFSQTARVQEEIAKSRPSVDWAMVKEAQDAYQRGEYQTVEELLRESQRVGP